MRRRSRGGPRLDRIVSALVLVGLLLLFYYAFGRREPARPPRPSGPPAPAGEYLFCHWNAENLFDDTDDPRNHDPLEDWFARRPAVLREKIDLLARALLEQNGGRGPDILGLVEVENGNAVELLRRALNDGLSEEWQYPATGLVHRDNTTGRRIEPAILSRLPIRAARDHDYGIRRIIEAHVEADGATLVVIESHWTSRVTDHTGAKRAAYADVLYDSVLDLYRRDPRVDALLAGDFNDEPADPSIRDHLRAVADPSAVRIGDPRPRLLNLMAGLDPRRGGTYLYGRGNWRILDHIVASPGLLDGLCWRVLPETLEVRNDPSLTVGRNRGPRRFGNESNQNPRGPSDHFAVTVRLRADGTPRVARAGD